MLVQGSAPAYQPRRVRHQLACHLRADGEKRRAAGPEQPLVASEHRPPGYRPRPSSGPHRPAPRTGTGPMPRAGRSRPGRPCPLASRPGPAAVPAGSAAAATRAWRCSERPPRTRTRCGPRRGDPHSPGRLLNIRKRDYSHPRARRNASTPASSRHLRLLMLGRTPRRRVRGPRRRPGARPSATLTPCRPTRSGSTSRPTWATAAGWGCGWTSSSTGRTGSNARFLLVARGVGLSRRVGYQRGQEPPRPVRRVTPATNAA